MDPRIPVKSTSVPTQPRYIPQDPSEVQLLASTIKVVRTSDQRKFLATKIPKVVVEEVDGRVGKTLLADVILPVAAVPISLILNHANIISLVDIVRNSDVSGTGPEAGPYGDITVWEDMDAGSLSYLLPSASTYPPFHDDVTWHALASQNYNRPALPEGLCWHVLRSISRALLWLHYGIKETIGIPGDFEKHDDDWHAILIMDISPGQIWFKRPVGEETYGACKLGGFQWAKVTGTVAGGHAIEQRVEHAPLAKQYFFPPEVYKNTHSHSRSSEIWQLGATIYVMMTGIPPPRLYEHSWQISRLNDGAYSQELREIIANMIKIHPNDRPDAISLVNDVDDQWKKWRATTKEGAYVVDILDREIELQALGISQGGLVL
ncbi:uncharacterized protein RSE6_00239 [Rhynchosporium secalis]|uniref:non-specific serine/threonine protein kinase n=1 Tax=Rhynchosporium secalis TaxID=38038 RepID=A0A1E1LUQ8_RHYSE|nr:uncharacterized protein RSE6_00239 [Rhynchosporium secalis]